MADPGFEMILRALGMLQDVGGKMQQLGEHRASLKQQREENALNRALQEKINRNEDITRLTLSLRDTFTGKLDVKTLEKVLRAKYGTKEVQPLVDEMYSGEARRIHSSMVKQNPDGSFQFDPKAYQQRLEIDEIPVKYGKDFISGPSKVPGPPPSTVTDVPAPESKFNIFAPGQHLGNMLYNAAPPNKAVQKIANTVAPVTEGVGNAVRGVGGFLNNLFTSPGAQPVTTPPPPSPLPPPIQTPVNVPGVLPSPVGPSQSIDINNLSPIERKLLEEQIRQKQNQILFR